MKQYDVVIIGAGVGGYTAAIRLAQYGKKVALVERDEAGGVCLNKGCIPTKALLHAALLYKLGKSGQTRSGIRFKGAEVDLDKLRDWRYGVSRRLTKGLLFLFRQYGIDFIKGEATIRGRNVIVGDELQLVGDKLILATGSRPYIPPSIKIDDYWTSYEALDIPEIPDSILIVGGGVIGVELATVYALLGSKVTIVEVLDDILSFLDRDLREIKKKELKRKGVKILTSSKLLSYTDKIARVETGDKIEEMFVSKVMISAGRVPNTELPHQMGLKMDGKFVKVKENYETSFKGVFAIGDLIKGPMLAHRAHRDGLRVADVIMGRFEPKRAIIPSIVYGEVSLVSVGLSEDELIENNISYNKGVFPFAANGRSLTMESVEGFCKILGNRDTGEIYGIHIAGAGVEELSGEITLAMNNGLTVKDLKDTVHAHPTLSEAIMEAAEHFYRTAIHIPNR